MFEFGYHILKHTALCILLSYWWLIDLGGQNPQLTLADCRGFFGMNCFDIEIFMWNLLDLETWDFYGWKVTLQAFLEMKVDGTTMKILSIDCAEVWELYQAGEFCGLGLNDWTTKTGDDEAYFGRYLLFEDVFATFARFEDVGLLWLDSHFARVFGNESGWSDWPFECNIAKFWQQSQAVMVYIYLVRVDQTFQYGLTGSALLNSEWRQFRAAF